MMMEENTFLNISLNLANIPSAYFCECCGRIIFPQTTQIIIPIFARLKDYFFTLTGIEVPYWPVYGIKMLARMGVK